MTAEEAILRKLLLEMFENQQNLFIVSKEIAPNDYEENLNMFMTILNDAQ